MALATLLALTAYACGDNSEAPDRPTERPTISASLSASPEPTTLKATPDAQVRSGWKRYESHAYGYSIEHPDGWQSHSATPPVGGSPIEVLTGDGGVFVMVSPGNAIRGFGSSNPSLEEMRERSVSFVRSFHGVEPELLADAPVLDTQAVLVRYPITISDKDYIQTHASLVVDGDAWLIDFTQLADDASNYESLLREMLSTFRVIDATS